MGEEEENRRVEVEKGLKTLKKEFPELNLRPFESTQADEWSEPMFEVSSPSWKPGLEILFAGFDTLREALEATDGLRGLRFLGTESAVAVGDSICVFVDGLPGGTKNQFLLCDADRRYEVHIRGENYRETATEPLEETPKTREVILDTPSEITKTVTRLSDSTDDQKRVLLVLAAFLLKAIQSGLEGLLARDKVAKLAKAALNALAFREPPPNPEGLAISNALWRGGDFVVITDTTGARDTLERSWKKIIDYVAFEYYRRQHVLLTVRPSSQKKAGGGGSVQIPLSPLPDVITLRPVRNEALQYLRLAEMSNVVTFRYLSFYHVLEHFFDEVAHETVYSEVMKVLSGPDLESKRDAYARAVGELVEDINIKPRVDDEKLKQTLRRFIPFSTVRDDLPEPIQRVLQKPVRFARGLRLDAVDLSDSERFFGGLTNRIYSMRNAIVHSKRAEAKSKGTFDLDGEDACKIADECEVLRHFALEVVSRAAVLE